MSGNDLKEFQPVDDGVLGVRSSNIGSFIPEGAYRPVPIVWFVAAWVVHSFSLFVLFAILINKPAIFTWLTTLLISFAVIRWTFNRGMRQAGRGWQIATVVALAINWGLVALTAAAR
ncbi:MAG: hypothetical protein ABIQ81_00380 [Novosphingobium sp.]